MKKKPKHSMEKAFWLKNLFLIACLLFTATPGFSQNKTVTGTVTDATGEPLIGASVLQQGTSNGVITDIDGKYSIQVPPEATLEFSYVGMVKQAVKVGNRSVIDVQMNDDSQMLAETVVIGYGSAKKRDLTGSITNIKGDEIANKPVVNPVAALQGKIAGVQVINSGKASATSAKPNNCPNVATTFSFAIRPDTAATAIFQPLPALVQPSGAKIHAIAEPIFARTHSAWAASRAAPSNPSKSSIPKVPLLHPKFIKNHKTIVDNRIIVPAFLMKDHPRSHMLRSTFPTVGQ